MSWHIFVVKHACLVLLGLSVPIRLLVTEYFLQDLENNGLALLLFLARSQVRFLRVVWDEGREKMISSSVVSTEECIVF